MRSEDIVFNLKGENTDLQAKIKESESTMKNMGEKMFSSKELGDPSVQAKKFTEQFGKGLESMKFDKRFDIMNSLMEQMNDPGTSMQNKMKIAKRMGTLLDEIHLITQSKIREYKSKGQAAGFSPEQIMEGMRHGLGETGEMWLGAGEYSKQVKEWGTGEGQVGGRGSSKNAGAEDLGVYAKKAAAYLVGYMVSDAIKNTGAMYQSLQMAEANIFQRAGTTFDLNSVMQTGLQTSAMHRENIMTGLQQRKQGYEVGGQMAGLGVGIGVGALLAPSTGGMSMGIAPLIGSALGSEVGGIFGTKDITDETRKQTHEIALDKMVGQLTGIAAQRVGVYDQMDTARAKFKARSGTADVGGQGTGYTSAELYSLGLQQEGVTGHFDKKTFTEQTQFSRAYGYNPSEIYNAGVSTRYTGEEVGASELFARKNLAEKTGMGSRLPELIQAINSLAGIMTKVGANVSEASVMQAANLPFMLFGDTARGRLGDQGMETLMGMNNMFNQAPGSAGDAFLYQAMKPKSLWDFELKKEQGIFGEGNLESVMDYAGKFKSPEMARHLFQSMKGGSASLTEAFVSKGFYQTSGVREDGTTYQKGEVNKEFMEQFNKIDMNTEEGAQNAADLLEVSKDAISGAEKHKRDMIEAMVKTGGDIAKSVREMQMKDVEMQNAILSDKRAWDVITATFERSIGNFQEAVNKLLGIETSNQATTDFVWNMFENDKPGDLRKKTLDRLKVGKTNIEEYSISAPEHARDPNSLYFDLDDPDRHDRDISSKYYRHVFRKRLKISHEALKELGITEDLKRLQENIDELARKKDLDSEDLFPPPPDPTNNPNYDPNLRAEGKKGTTVVINITAADRAEIHSRLDEALNNMETMANPSKIQTNF